MSTEWTEVMIATLTRMWHAGDSGSAIAKHLGVSKNSVVGKKKRLGLPDRVNPVKGDAAAAAVAKTPKAEKPQARREALKTVVSTPELVAAPPVAEMVFRPRKRGGCQWPMWGFSEPPTHVYCDAPAHCETAVYCAAHHAKGKTVVPYRVAA